MIVYIGAALRAFSSTYAVLIKSQVAHWNVEGENFLQYHELFGNIYKEIESSIDSFAEHIRAIHGYVKVGFMELETHSAVKTDPVTGDYVLDLLKCNNDLICILTNLYELCDREGLHGFSAFISDRIDAHTKHSWMLEATAKRKAP